MTDRQRLVIEHPVHVPFYDVDSMEVVWHGNYLKYFEEARCALLNHIDYNYEAMRDSGFAWPVVDVRIKYIKPLRFNQHVIVHVELTEWENRLRLDYEILDSKTREKLTTAYSIQVAVDMKQQELQFVLPDIFRQKIARCLSSGNKPG